MKSAKVLAKVEFHFLIRYVSLLLFIKFIYSEKTTKFGEISLLVLTLLIEGDFFNLFGLLGKYELHYDHWSSFRSTE